MKHPPSGTLHFSQDLLSLQQGYVKRLSGYMADLRRLQELLNRGLAPIGDLQQLYRITHNLAGSGTTLGFPAISKTAHELHEALRTFMDSNVNSDEKLHHERSHVQEKLQWFFDACRDVVAQKPLTLPEGEGALKSLSLLQAKPKTIGIIAKKIQAAENVAKQLMDMGYHVVFSESYTDLQTQANATCTLDAVLVFSNLNATDIAALESDLRQYQTEALPLIFITPRRDFEARLAAVRLGALGFVSEDADMLEIADMLEQLILLKNNNSELTILIVNSDDMLAGFYEHTLKHASMQAVIVKDHKEIFAALAKHKPGAVLIDIDTSDCTAQELAAVIREHEGYQRLPIIFIAKPEEPLHPLFRAEDSLAKPFTPAQLIDAIKWRL